MTVTVKLDTNLEQQLRQRAAATGQTTSDVIRSALQAYLAQEPEAAPPSSHALGAELFGRYSGPADLAATRKAALADIWSSKVRR